MAPSQVAPAKRFKGADGAGSRPAPAPAVETYEVRYKLPIEAEAALSLNGSEIEGYVITVRPDESSKDGTKIMVEGLPPNVATEELKGLFSGAGQVVFAGPPKKSLGGGKGGAGGPGIARGEVRYETPDEALQAVGLLNGSILEGCPITASLDTTSKDSSKLTLTGLPAGLQWQELKDHCMQAGRVAFVDVKGGGGGGAGGGKGGGSIGCEAEVRFDDPSHAVQALQQLNGSMLGGSPIYIRPDPNSKDQTRILVAGFPSNIQWQELKDHFNVVGTVAFAQVKGGSPAAAPMAPMAMIPYGMPGVGKAGKGMYGKVAMPAMVGGKGAMMNAMWYGTPAMGGWGGGGGKGFAPAGGKRGGGGGGGGEVRYDNPSHARMAIAKLNGSMMQGSRITVHADESSQDCSKLIVSGIPPGCQWQEVKDHFGQIGRVAFASIVGPGEVRMETAEEAQRAVALMNGSTVFGPKISVSLDMKSKDGTRILVTGLPPGANWQQIKDAFSQAGTVAFVTRQEGGK